MEKLEISTQLGNAILAYLGTRPYQEVFQLISALQQEAQSQVTPQEPETAPPNTEEQPNA